MKNVSETFIAKELADQRLPAELYHIWIQDRHFYHTSGDTPIVFQGKKYLPGTIGRGEISFNAELEVSELEVTFSRITQPMIEYIANNPVDLAWIEVIKLFRDSDPLEGNPIFIGQIHTISFQGAAATAKCVGFEFFLSQLIPRWEYTEHCNHIVGDSGCGVDLSSSTYSVTATVSVEDAEGLILSSSAFGSYADDWFTYGWAQWETEKRPIHAHFGITIELKYAFSNLQTGQSVTVYAGCDNRIETCRDKFANVVNFLGFPYIPEDNPVTWSAG